MIDVEPLVRSELDHLVALPPDAQPDWNDVRRRVVRRQGVRSFVLRRPVLAVAIVLAAAVVPVGSLAVAKNDPWWFAHGMLAPFKPAKGSSVVVIKKGTWSGVEWALYGYRSQSGGLCYGVGQTSRPTGGGACGQIPGTRAAGRPAEPTRIGWLSGGGSPNDVPHFIAGPVVPTASRVVIHLFDGTVVSTPTFTAPPALGIPIRFFATQLPARPTGGNSSCVARMTRDLEVAPQKIVALDGSGNIVASVSRPAVREQKLAHLRCNPHPQPIGPTAGTKSIAPVLEIGGPYGTSATLGLGKIFPLQEGHFLPSGMIQKSEQPSRCWKVSFSDGRYQGGCLPIAQRKGTPYFAGWGIEHVGHAVFVVAYASGPRVTRITLRVAPGKILSARTRGGVAVFAVPRAYLVTAHSAPHQLTGYDAHGHEVGRHLVYYRSCPNADASGGGGC